jgi:D-alanyl-D-alanine carboxypeptidase/S-layer homology domain
MEGMPRWVLERAVAARGVVGLILLVVFVLAMSLPAQGFSDVPAGNRFATAIDDLSSRSIIGGFDDGTFRPTAPVTRQQFAKMIVGALYLPASTADKCPFPDVVSSRSADLYPDHYVAVAAANSITEGYGDGLFRPYSNISRAQVITMVVRAVKRLNPLGLQSSRSDTILPGGWENLSGEHRDNARLAYANGLLAGLDYWVAARDPYAAMPRGEVAQVLYDLKGLLPAAPEFRSSIQEIDDALRAQMLRSGSWKPGVPITFAELRLIHVSYWGFDGQAHTGRLVVNRAWASDLCDVFRQIYEARFPIWSMNLIDDYGASDPLSMAADNTSSFNGRFRGDANVWSMHAYGLAVDVNPLENPWVRAYKVSPAAGQAYVDRSISAPGIIRGGDMVVRAFASIGWKWGGYWESSKDYQHFSSNGQ